MDKLTCIATAETEAHIVLMQDHISAISSVKTERHYSTLVNRYTLWVPVEDARGLYVRLQMAGLV